MELPPDPDCTRARPIARALIVHAPTIVLAAAGVALVLHAVVRDAVPILATFHHATPLPVIVGLALLGALLGVRAGRRVTAVSGALLASIAAVAFVATAHVDASPASLAGTGRSARPAHSSRIRCVLWNLRHGAQGWTRIVRELAAVDADLILLVEASDQDAPLDDLLAGAFPAHARLRTRGAFVALARDAIELERYTRLPGRGRAANLRVTVHDRTFPVILADIAPSLRSSRASSFADLADLMEPHRNDPLLMVAGDFNTPRRSVHFDGYRDTLTHAFEQAGHGFDMTWPTLFPLLAIDHAWVGDGWDVARCRHVTTAASDHRMVVFELR